jgi:hypothetical protein
LRFDRLFAHGKLPQGDFELLDFRRQVTRARGPGAAQIDGQMHQVQAKTYFIKYLFIHSKEIG